MVRITTQPLDAAEAVRAVEGPEHGAVVVFEGRTRQWSGGRRVVRLEYELYPEMVERELELLTAEILEAHPVGRVAFLVRGGPVPVGEASVVVAVGAGHRAAAFAACRHGIDELKRRVPIWKKEIFEDGEAWVEPAGDARA
ncbi:MAG TPA: molybdenum cofactor biosynthesis protein MoaE [Candidatus Saccharimonadales bacterium]|nr:molybdenum cofactor biosynthesis protein MoaE [Candidatus Saccharimonadales bacterium]